MLYQYYDIYFSIVSHIDGMPTHVIGVICPENYETNKYNIQFGMDISGSRVRTFLFICTTSW